MTKQTRLPVYVFIGLIASSTMLAGCIIHVGASDGEGSYYSDGERNYNTTNKSVSVAKGLSVDDVSSVNGSVKIGDDASVREVSSVNGSIRIGDKVSVTSVESVNGRVTAGEKFTAAESVETVNGSITIAEKSRIGKNIETVNGKIQLTNTEVGEDITTTNGSVYLLNGSVVKGDVIFEGKPNYNSNQKIRLPILKVDANSDIEGQIIVYKDVEFDFANSNLMDKVVRR